MERHIGDNVPARRLLYALLVFHQMWNCFLWTANPSPCSRWCNDRNWWFRLWAMGTSFEISNMDMIHQGKRMIYFNCHLPYSHWYTLCWPYMRQQWSNEFLLCNTCISPHLSGEWLPTHLVFSSYRESYPRSFWWHFRSAQHRCNECVNRQSFAKERTFGWGVLTIHSDCACLLVGYLCRNQIVVDAIDQDLNILVF